MMGGISLDGLLQFAVNYGPAGIILLLWWLDQRAIAKILKQYRQDTEVHWKMYEHNVELVKRYGDLAADQKDMIIMNTQAWTRTHEAVEGNRFCPMVRLEKKATGVQG